MQEEIKQAVRDVLADAFAPPQPPSYEELEAFYRENYCTLSEAILIAESAGVKLRTNTKQQFHLLCKNGKIASFKVGEKNNVVVLTRSLMEWITTQKEKG